MEASTRLLCERGKLTIKWEDLDIDIPINFDDLSNAMLYKIVRDMQSEIRKLKEQLNNNCPRETLFLQGTLEEVWSSQEEDVWDKL